MRATNLLFSLTLLQVYNGDPDAVAVLDELQVWYSSNFVNENLSKPKVASIQANFFNPLMDILLSFIAKPSTFYRKIVEHVFWTFSSQMTAESLQSMVEILEKSENLEGQCELFDNEDNDDDDISSNESNESKDEEKLSVATSESDEYDEENLEENAEGLAEFNDSLSKALKSVEMNNDKEAGDESPEDEDMDDEEMMALEPQLSKIFQQRKLALNERKEKKNAKETVINFKNRVLDLLLIYCKKEFASPLSATLIVPLLRLTRVTSSEQIAKKTANLLREYMDACKGKRSIQPLDRTFLQTLLTEIQSETGKGSSKLHAMACSRSSLFVVRQLTSIDKELYNVAIDAYVVTLKDWFARPKSRVQPMLFTDLINWSVEARKQR